MCSAPEKPPQSFQRRLWRLIHLVVPHRHHGKLHRLTEFARLVEQRLRGFGRGHLVLLAQHKEQFGAQFGYRIQPSRVAVAG